MGCDGGTIPKRSEVVKNKTKGEVKDKQADLAAKWHFCHLSGFPLTKPIVACQLGHLYNKDKLIEYLLDLKINCDEINPELSHIRNLKDVKEIKLKEKTDSEPGAHQVHSGNEKFRAQYVCPISGLDMNGKYKFFYSLKCGCVISEKAIREVPDDGICIVCSQIYNMDMDLIVINGDDNELKKLQEKLEIRKESQKLARQLAKKDKSHNRNDNNNDKKNKSEYINHEDQVDKPSSSSAIMNVGSKSKRERLDSSPNGGERIKIRKHEVAHKSTKAR